MKSGIKSAVVGHWGLLAWFALGLAGPARAEPFEQVLTSTSRNVRVEAWEAAAQEITPDCPHAWSVRKITLRGGKQEGVEIVEVNNGRLTFTVIPTRGMGILRAALDDVRLGWDSPVQEVVHPKFINLHSRGGLGWLEGFNEWLCRCGLENNGQPGSDTFINNLGEEATMELTLHGKIANLPAQEVEVVVEREPPFRIHVRGRVDEKMFYGPKLELATDISTEAGSNLLRIADTITNRGAQPQELQVLYHANYGRPLLEEGASFAGPLERVTPFNEHAATAVQSFATYGPPELGFIEQVYLLRLHADDVGQTLIMLQNKAQDRAVSMAYSLAELPYLTIWKNTAAEADGYVTGLEPGINYPNNRRVERKLGRVPKLAAGESRQLTIDVGIHIGPDQVRDVASRIAAIQAGRETTIDPGPASVDE